MQHEEQLLGRRGRPFGHLLLCAPPSRSLSGLSMTPCLLEICMRLRSNKQNTPEISRHSAAAYEYFMSWQSATGNRLLFWRPTGDSRGAFQSARQIVAYKSIKLLINSDNKTKRQQQQQQQLQPTTNRVLGSQFNGATFQRGKG